MITKGDRRARSLLLQPKPRATKEQRGDFVIAPRMTDADAIEMEGSRRCVNYNKTGKVIL